MNVVLLKVSMISPIDNMQLRCLGNVVRRDRECSPFAARMHTGRRSPAHRIRGCDSNCLLDF